MVTMNSLEERSSKCSMLFIKAKNQRLLIRFPSNIGSTITSLRMDGQRYILTNKKTTIFTEMSLKRYLIFDHLESTSIFKSSNAISRMWTANGSLQLTMRWSVCPCWRCPAEISNTSMTSSTFMYTGLDITIALLILHFNGVLQITLRQKCRNINVIKGSPSSHDCLLDKILFIQLIYN